MTYVGSQWVELDRWADTTVSGYDAEWRVMAYSVQNTITNRSTVYFKLQKSMSGGYYIENYSNLDFEIECDDEEDHGHTATQTWVYGRVSDTSWHDVGGDTHDMYWSDVRHKSNGTCSISATASGDRWGGGTFSTSISITLPTIPRESIPTAEPNPIKLSNANNTLTVYTNRKSSAFTHTITVTLGSYTDTQYSIGTSTTFSIPKTVLADFDANSKTKTGTINCLTYNGNAYVGSKTVNFTASIDTDIEYPTVNSIVIEDLNAKSEAVEAQGSLIQYASHLKATITLGVVGSYTQLASVDVQCGSVTQTYTFPTYPTSATVTFEYNKVDANHVLVYATDRRGTVVGSSKNWTLVPYVDLTALAEVHRTSETGNTISVKVTGQCYAGSFGNATNEITVYYKKKLHTDADYPATWTTINTLTPSGNNEPTTYDFTNNNTPISGFDYDKQYDIKFKVEDMFTEAESQEIVITTGIPVYGNGSDFFAVYGNLHIHDRTDPTQYWTLSQANDLVTAISDIQSALAMSNVSASGSYTNSSASQAFSVTGSGIVIFNVYAVSASNQDDTGQVEAYVQLLNSSNVLQATLARDGNRLSSSSTFRNAANASGAYYFDGGTNNRLNFYTSNTKNGSTSWRIQIVAIGCTVTAL